MAFNGPYNSLSDSALLPTPPFILAFGSRCRVDGVEFIDINGGGMVATAPYTAQTAQAVSCAVFRRANNLNINNKNI